MVTIDPPSTVGGITAAATASISNGTVSSVTITNQGSGYIAPPILHFSGGCTIEPTVTAQIGTVVPGIPTPGGQDGWVVQITEVGSTTPSSNGVAGSIPGYETATMTLPFPALVYGTLVTGDETNSNGTGAAPVSGATTNVTGIAVDNLGQAYVSGSINTTSYTGTPPAAGNNQAVIIRRRINANGWQVTPGTPFQLNTPTQGLNDAPNPSNLVNPIGDINLGVGSTALPPLGQANGVAYDPTTGKSCFGGWVSQPLQTPSAGPQTANDILQPNAFQPSVTISPGATTGFIGCAPFPNDVTLSTNFQLVAMPSGSTPGNSPPNPGGGNFPCPVVGPSCSVVGQIGQITVNVPGGNATPLTISPITYTPPDNTAGPASSTAAANPWLGTSVNGNTITVFVTSFASDLDPGEQIATFTVTPPVGSGGNGGVPQPVLSGPFPPPIGAGRSYLHISGGFEYRDGGNHGAGSGHGAAVHREFRRRQL